MIKPIKARGAYEEMGFGEDMLRGFPLIPPTNRTIPRSGTLSSMVDSKHESEFGLRKRVRELASKRHAEPQGDRGPTKVPGAPSEPRMTRAHPKDSEASPEPRIPRHNPRNPRGQRGRVRVRRYLYRIPCKKAGVPVVS